jgi:hypothetical protein
MPLLLNDLGPCPVCAAAVPVTGPLYRLHIAWHEATGTNVPPAGVGRVTDDDDAPTVQFPPIRETVLRRPPPPAVRELRGSELLLALAEELGKAERAGEDLDDEPDAADDADDFERLPNVCYWQPEPGSSWPTSCEYPESSPCRAYGAPGCRMKAEEGR